MEWKFSQKPILYSDAIMQMEKRVNDIINDYADELIWFLEHPSVITGGTSAKADDLLNKDLFPVHMTGRGGQYTYHGPGQQVVYLMLNLEKRKMMDIKKYVLMLENWIISCLKKFSIEGYIRKGRIGVWVPTSKTQEDKIAAIGVRVKKWVTYHGIALNICPDLSHFNVINPCGIQNTQTQTYGVTSLKALGKNISTKEVQKTMIKELKSALQATDI